MASNKCLKITQISNILNLHTSKNVNNYFLENFANWSINVKDNLKMFISKISATYIPFSGKIDKVKQEMTLLHIFLSMISGVLTMRRVCSVMFVLYT